MAGSESGMEVLMKTSFLDTNYDLRQHWSVSGIVNIEKSNFIDEYELKRLQLTQLGRTGDETIDRCVFAYCSNLDNVKGVIERGITVTTSNNTSRVIDSKAVVLYRHADILLKVAAYHHRERCWLIICKAMFGRAFDFVLGPDVVLEPVAGADSLVVGEASLTDNLPNQVLKSQVCLYETDRSSATGFASRPRHCLPLALIELSAAPLLSNSFVKSTVRLVSMPTHVPQNVSLAVLQSQPIAIQFQGNRLPSPIYNVCQLRQPVLNHESGTVYNRCPTVSASVTPSSASNPGSVNLGSLNLVSSPSATLDEHIKFLKLHCRTVKLFVTAFKKEMHALSCKLQQLRSIVALSGSLGTSLSTVARIITSSNDLREKCQQYKSYLERIELNDPSVQYASVEVLRHNVNALLQCLRTLMNIFNELRGWANATPSVISGLSFSNAIIRKELDILNQLEVFRMTLTGVIRYSPASTSSSSVTQSVALPVPCVVADGAIRSVLQNGMSELRQCSRINVNETVHLEPCELEQSSRQPIIIQPDGTGDDDEASFKPNLVPNIKTESLSERRHRISNEPFNAIILDLEDLIADAVLSAHDGDDISGEVSKCQKIITSALQPTAANEEASHVRSIVAASDDCQFGVDEKMKFAVNGHQHMLNTQCIMESDGASSASSISSNVSFQNLSIANDKAPDVIKVNESCNVVNQNTSVTVSSDNSCTSDDSGVSVSACSASHIGDSNLTEMAGCLSAQVSRTISETSSAPASIVDNRVCETIQVASEQVEKCALDIVNGTSNNGNAQLNWSGSGKITPSRNSNRFSEGAVSSSNSSSSSCDEVDCCRTDPVESEHLPSCVPDDSSAQVSGGDTSMHLVSKAEPLSLPVSKEEPLSLVVSTNQRRSLYFDLDCANKVELGCELKYLTGIDDESLCKLACSDESLDMQTVNLSIDQAADAAMSPSNRSTSQVNSFNAFDDNLSNLIASVIGVLESKPESHFASQTPSVPNSRSESLPSIADTINGETGRKNSSLHSKTEPGLTCIKQDLDVSSYHDEVLENSGLFRISSVCSVKSESHDGLSVQTNTPDNNELGESDEIIRTIRTLNCEQKILFKIRDDMACTETNDGIVVKQEVVDEDPIGSCASPLNTDNDMYFGINSHQGMVKAERCAITDELNLSKTIDAIRDLVAKSAFHSAATANFANLNTVAKGKKRKRGKSLKKPRNKKCKVPVAYDENVMASNDDVQSPHSTVSKPSSVLSTLNSGLVDRTKKSVELFESRTKDAISDGIHEGHRVTRQDSLMSSLNHDSSVTKAVSDGAAGTDLHAPQPKKLKCKKLKSVVQKDVSDHCEVVESASETSKTNDVLIEPLIRQAKVVKGSKRATVSRKRRKKKRVRKKGGGVNKKNSIEIMKLQGPVNETPETNTVLVEEALDEQPKVDDDSMQKNVARKPRKKKNDTEVNSNATETAIVTLDTSTVTLPEYGTEEVNKNATESAIVTLGTSTVTLPEYGTEDVDKNAAESNIVTLETMPVSLPVYGTKDLNTNSTASAIATVTFKTKEVLVENEQGIDECLLKTPVLRQTKKNQKRNIIERESKVTPAEQVNVSEIESNDERKEFQEENHSHVEVNEPVCEPILSVKDKIKASFCRSEFTRLDRDSTNCLLKKGIKRSAMLKQTDVGVSKVLQTDVGVSKVLQTDVGVSKVLQTDVVVSKVLQTDVGISKVLQTDVGVSKVFQTDVGVSKVLNNKNDLELNLEIKSQSTVESVIQKSIQKAASVEYVSALSGANLPKRDEIEYRCFKKPADSAPVRLNHSTTSPVYYTGIMQSYIPELLSLHIEPSDVSISSRSHLVPLPGSQPSLSSAQSTPVSIRNRGDKFPGYSVGSAVSLEDWKLNEPSAGRARRVSYEDYRQKHSEPCKAVRAECREFSGPQWSSMKLSAAEDGAAKGALVIDSQDILTELSAEESLLKSVIDESDWHCASRVIRCPSGTLMPTVDRDSTVQTADFVQSNNNSSLCFDPVLAQSELLALNDLEALNDDQPLAEDVDLVLKFPATRMNGMFWKLIPVDRSQHAYKYYEWLYEESLLDTFKGAKADPRLRRTRFVFDNTPAAREDGNKQQKPSQESTAHHQRSLNKGLETGVNLTKKIMQDIDLRINRELPASHSGLTSDVAPDMDKLAKSHSDLGLENAVNNSSAAMRNNGSRYTMTEKAQVQHHGSGNKSPNGPLSMVDDILPNHLAVEENDGCLMIDLEEDHADGSSSQMLPGEHQEVASSNSVLENAGRSRVSNGQQLGVKLSSSENQVNIKAICSAVDIISTTRSSLGRVDAEIKSVGLVGNESVGPGNGTVDSGCAGNAKPAVDPGKVEAYGHISKQLKETMTRLNYSSSKRREISSNPKTKSRSLSEESCSTLVGSTTQITSGVIKPHHSSYQHNTDVRKENLCTKPDSVKPVSKSDLESCKVVPPSSSHRSSSTSSGKGNTIPRRPSHTSQCPPLESTDSSVKDVRGELSMNTQKTVSHKVASVNGSGKSSNKNDKLSTKSKESVRHHAATVISSDGLPSLGTKSSSKLLFDDPVICTDSSSADQKLPSKSKPLKHDLCDDKSSSFKKVSDNLAQSEGKTSGKIKSEMPSCAKASDKFLREKLSLSGRKRSESMGSGISATNKDIPLDKVSSTKLLSSEQQSIKRIKPEISSSMCGMASSSKLSSSSAKLSGNKSASAIVSSSSHGSSCKPKSAVSTTGDEFSSTKLSSEPSDETKLSISSATKDRSDRKSSSAGSSSSLREASSKKKYEVSTTVSEKLNNTSASTSMSSHGASSKLQSAVPKAGLEKIHKSASQPIRRKDSAVSTTVIEKIDSLPNNSPSHKTSSQVKTAISTAASQKSHVNLKADKSPLLPTHESGSKVKSAVSTTVDEKSNKKSTSACLSSSSHRFRDEGKSAVSSAGCETSHSRLTSAKLSIPAHELTSKVKSTVSIIVGERSSNKLASSEISSSSHDLSKSKVQSAVFTAPSEKSRNKLASAKLTSRASLCDMKSVVPTAVGEMSESKSAPTKESSSKEKSGVSAPVSVKFNSNKLESAEISSSSHELSNKVKTAVSTTGYEKKQTSAKLSQNSRQSADVAKSVASSTDCDDFLVKVSSVKLPSSDLKSNAKLRMATSLESIVTSHNSAQVLPCEHTSKKYSLLVPNSSKCIERQPLNKLSSEKSHSAVRRKSEISTVATSETVFEPPSIKNGFSALQYPGSKELAKSLDNFKNLKSKDSSSRKPARECINKSGTGGETGRGCSLEAIQSSSVNDLVGSPVELTSSNQSAVKSYRIPKQREVKEIPSGIKNKSNLLASEQESEKSSSYLVETKDRLLSMSTEFSPDTDVGTKRNVADSSDSKYSLGILPSRLAKQGSSLKRSLIRPYELTSTNNLDVLQPESIASSSSVELANADVKVKQKMHRAVETEMRTHTVESINSIADEKLQASSLQPCASDRGASAIVPIAKQTTIRNAVNQKDSQNSFSISTRKDFVPTVSGESLFEPPIKKKMIEIEKNGPGAMHSISGKLQKDSLVNDAVKPNISFTELNTKLSDKNIELPPLNYCGNKSSMGQQYGKSKEKIHSDESESSARNCRISGKVSPIGGNNSPAFDNCDSLKWKHPKDFEPIPEKGQSIIDLEIKTGLKEGNKVLLKSKAALLPTPIILPDKSIENPNNRGFGDLLDDEIFQMSCDPHSDEALNAIQRSSMHVKPGDFITETQQELERYERLFIKRNTFSCSVSEIKSDEKKKLVAQNSLLPRVKHELIVDLRLGTLHREIERIQGLMEDINNRFDCSHPSQSLERRYEKYELKLDYLRVRCDWNYSRLNGFHRYYKSHLVIVLPDNLQVRSEHQRYISEDGYLLFLPSMTISLHQCIQLAALTKLIDKYQSDSFQNGHKLEWLREERRRQLENVCCTTIQQRDELVNSLNQKLDVFRFVRIDMNRKPRQHENGRAIQLKQFIDETVQLLQLYLHILENAKKTVDGRWQLNEDTHVQDDGNFERGSGIGTTRQPPGPGMSRQAVARVTLLPDPIIAQPEPNTAQASKVKLTLLPDPEMCHSEPSMHRQSEVRLARPRGPNMGHTRLGFSRHPKLKRTRHMGLDSKAKRRQSVLADVNSELEKKRRMAEELNTISEYICETVGSFVQRDPRVSHMLPGCQTSPRKRPMHGAIFDDDIERREQNFNLSNRKSFDFSVSRKSRRWFQPVRHTNYPPEPFKNFSPATNASSRSFGHKFEQHEQPSPNRSQEHFSRQPYRKPRRLFRSDGSFPESLDDDNSFRRPLKEKRFDSRFHNAGDDYGFLAEGSDERRDRSRDFPSSSSRGWERSPSRGFTRDADHWDSPPLRPSDTTSCFAKMWNERSHSPKPCYRDDVDNRRSCRGDRHKPW